LYQLRQSLSFSCCLYNRHELEFHPYFDLVNHKPTKLSKSPHSQNLSLVLLRGTHSGSSPDSPPIHQVSLPAMNRFVNTPKHGMARPKMHSKWSVDELKLVHDVQMDTYYAKSVGGIKYPITYWWKKFRTKKSLTRNP
jgi:hypothetical protein